MWKPFVVACGLAVMGCSSTQTTNNADAAVDAGSGAGCKADDQQGGCSCNDLYSTPPNKNKCDLTTVPGGVCCKLTDPMQAGLCTCHLPSCADFNNGVPNCTCSVFPLPDAGTKASCNKPANGTCCLNQDKTSCACSAATNCGAPSTEVPSCTPTSVLFCPPGQQSVNACSK